MKKLISLATILIAFSLTSCFEIVEEITLKKTGAGHLNYTLNLSQSKTKLNSIMVLDSVNGHKIPSQNEIKIEFDKVGNSIKAISGVSNFKKSLDLENYIFSISLDFTSVEVLNKIISSFSNKADKNAIQKVKHFSYNTTSKLFLRGYHYNFSDKIKQVKNKDREIFKNATYTTIYRFENEISSSSNSDAKIAGSKKAIMLKVPANQIINNTKNIKNKIQLK